MGSEGKWVWLCVGLWVKKKLLWKQACSRPYDQKERPSCMTKAGIHVYDQKLLWHRAYPLFVISKISTHVEHVRSSYQKTRMKEQQQVMKEKQRVEENNKHEK